MGKQNQTIPLIIPAYEPDDRMPPLLKTLYEAGVQPIILVDDGSGSDYRHYFEDAKEQYGCVVLTHSVNLGKGRALKTAFNYCLAEYPDMLGCVTADSDGQHTVEDIQKCMAALTESPEALILGCRDFSGDGIPKKSRFGNNLTKAICSGLCGVKVSDTQTGLRAIPREFMKSLMQVAGERFEFETRMLIVTKDSYPIKEIPIQTIYDSKENHQTHFDPIRDSVRIYVIFAAVFARFLLSSVTSFVVDILLFSLFCTVFEPLVAVYYTAIATVLARVISGAYNYLVNYALVFKSGEKHRRATWKYIVLCLAQMCISAAAVTALAWLLPTIPEVGIKIVVDMVLFFLSFVIQRDMIFKR